MIAVNEFISRLEQGYTEAFLCRGEDGHLYVTKSVRSGREALVREWICGRIGQMFGLPIPTIQLLYAAKSTAQYSGNQDLEALADEPGFGSRFVGSNKGAPSVGAMTLGATDISKIDPNLRCKVLLFDWWVLNFDRTDDNPNLLFEPVTNELHVIDHNLAFDDDPSEQFWPDHIFRSDRRALSDPLRQTSDLESMSAILTSVDSIWRELPEPWVDHCSLTLDRVDSILRRCLGDDFWTVA